MAFVDRPLFAGLVGKTVSGISISKTAAMTLEVAAGSMTHHKDGAIRTLSAVKSHVFTSDATYKTQALAALIDNGTTVDVWFDEYVDDGVNARGTIPEGYTFIMEIVWFTIAISETNLDNSSINRRTWL